jgi:hypothetical protein
MKEENYVPMEEIRKDVFFGISRVRLWELRQHPRFPKAIGMRPLYYDKPAVIRWRNKYWNRRMM